jgi:hypothetical protein
MQLNVTELSIDILLSVVLMLKIIHLHFEHKTIKALTESAKTSNQRLDSLEKKLLDK